MQIKFETALINCLSHGSGRQIAVKQAKESVRDRTPLFSSWVSNG